MSTPPKVATTANAFRFQQELLRTSPVATSSPEERLLLLEAERDVRDLLVAYSAYYDAADVDALVELFAEDAVVRNLQGEHVGRAAIREAYAFLIEHLSQCLHYITNVVVRIDSSDAARAASYLHSLATRRSDGFTYGTGGTYSHRFGRRDGRWEILEHVVTSFIPYELEAMPADYDRFDPDAHGR